MNTYNIAFPRTVFYKGSPDRVTILFVVIFLINIHKCISDNYAVIILFLFPPPPKKSRNSP